MKVAVLGSGAGGCAVAMDWARAGHRVALFDFDRFPENIAAIAQQGGIHAEGGLAGFAPVEYAGHDLDAALDGAGVVFVVGPAYSTQPFGEACRGRLREGQTVVVCPGSCAGAIALKRAAGLALEDERVLVADTSTLPYAVRVTGPGRIRVFLKLRGGVFLAAIPGRRTAEALAAVQPVYPSMAPARNVLQTALQNGNPVIHPAVTLLNAALIERTAGAFGFYEEGVTPAVGRLMEAVDRERLSIAARLGLDILPDPALGVLQGYMEEANYGAGYARAPGFRGIRAQPALDHRYIEEDVGYGLVFMTSLGRLGGVPTPVMDAVIALAGVLVGREFRADDRRSMASLGLDREPLDHLLQRL